MKREPAVSQVKGIILILVCTVILAVIICSWLFGFSLLFDDDSIAPPLFKITSVNHGTGKFESIVIIQNTADRDFPNRDLIARFYRNKELILTGIFTLNGHDFIPTHHTGVQYIGGEGSRGALFARHEMLKINMKNGLIHPGDCVELRIYQKSVRPALNVISGGQMMNLNCLYDRVQEEYWGSFPGYGLISQHRFEA